MSSTDPRFYWYDEEGKSLSTLDAGRPLARIEDIPTYDVQDAKNGYGTAYRTAMAGGMRVRLVFQNVPLTGTAGEAFEHGLRTLWSHLQRGGRCGFSRNHSKSYAGFSVGMATRGQAYGTSGANAFASYSPSAVLSTNDPIVLETGNPDQRREYHRLNTISGSQFSFSGTTMYNDLGSYLLRYRWFWPFLYLPQDLVGQNPFSDQYRIHFTFDCTLEVDPIVYLLTSEETAGQPLPLALVGSGVEYSRTGQGSAGNPFAMGNNSPNVGGGAALAQMHSILNAVRGRKI